MTIQLRRHFGTDQGTLPSARGTSGHRFSFTPLLEQLLRIECNMFQPLICPDTRSFGVGGWQLCTDVTSADVFRSPAGSRARTDQTQTSHTCVWRGQLRTRRAEQGSTACLYGCEHSNICSDCMYH